MKNGTVFGMFSCANFTKNRNEFVFCWMLINFFIFTLQNMANLKMAIFSSFPSLNFRNRTREVQMQCQLF